jgi:hypothetical protein
MNRAMIQIDIENYNFAIDSLSSEIESLGAQRDALARQLVGDIGTDWGMPNPKANNLLSRIAETNALMKEKAEKRRDLRGKRNRLSNTFRFTEPEVRALIDLVGREIDNGGNKQWNELWQSIYQELDEIKLEGAS